MTERAPIDAGRYPAMFFLGKGYDPIDQQFIRLALIVQIIRVQSKDQSLAQFHLLPREIFYGSDTIQPNTALGIRVVEVCVDPWLQHADAPFIRASWRDCEWSVQVSNSRLRAQANHGCMMRAAARGSHHITPGRTDRANGSHAYLTVGDCHCQLLHRQPFRAFD